jgi:Flp pilus assembly pilin Flp
MISLRQLTKQEDGQDLMEYGLLVSLIAIALMFVIRLMATSITDTFWGTIATIDFF